MQINTHMGMTTILIFMWSHYLDEERLKKIYKNKNKKLYVGPRLMRSLSIVGSLKELYMEEEPCFRVSIIICNLNG